MELAGNIEDDVDPTLASQDEVRKHWEEKFAAEDHANLFPRPSSASKPARRQSSGQYNADDVDTNPMANMNTIKRQWESKMMLDTPEEAVVARKTSTCSEPDHSECDSSLNNNSIYSNSVRNTENCVPSYESAIERDIRLAQEREKEFRREHERLQNAAKDSGEETPTTTQKMRVDVSLVTSPAGDGRSVSVTSPGAVFAPSPQPQVSGSVSNDIQRDVIVARLKSRNSSCDDSWRTEKGRSRPVSGSIVEREIRMQQDREAELVQLRTSLYQSSTDNQPVLDTPQPRNEVTPNNVAPSLPVPEAKSPEPDSTASAVSCTTTKTPEMRAASPGRLAIKMSTYRTSGDVIASELREYEEREAELRRRWVAMGLDVPNASPSQAVDPERATSPRRAPCELPVKQPQTVASSVHNGALSEDGSDAYRRASTTDSEASFQSGDSAARFHKQLKVHPIVDDMDETDLAAAKYVPRTETPIEREMRLAQERENELRCQRGLTPVSPLPSEANNVTPDSEMAPLEKFRLRQTGTRQGDGGDACGARMKRFSSGRLQSEIERDRQKELQLREEGKITSLSDERVARPAIYTEIVQH